MRQIAAENLEDENRMSLLAVSENSPPAVVKEVSLKKANKLRNTLQAICKKNKEGALEAYVTIQYSQNNPMKLDIFKEQINKRIEKAQEDVDTYVRQNVDYRKLKDAIFKANVGTGVSDVLSQMELLQLKKKMYQSLEKKLDSFSSGGMFGRSGGLTVDIDASYAALNRERENQYQYDSSVNCAVYEPDELQRKIKDITRHISTLEDKRDEINANTRVSLSFLDPRTLEDLGL